MYFVTYFIILAALMIIICAALIVLIFIFGLPSLTQTPAIITLCILIFLYCPSSILYSTSVSYLFDKTDSAQSILPNVVPLLGGIPFLMVIFLDMLGIGKSYLNIPNITCVPK